MKPAMREKAPSRAEGERRFDLRKSENPPARCARHPPYQGGKTKSFLRRRAEVDRWRLGDRLFVLDAELRLRLEAEEHRGEVDRELAHVGVELLHRLDIALARHRDAVLGALELRLQLAEVLVGLE